MVEVAALVLAAGRASRYRAAGGAAPTKLVASYRTKPLVRWAVEAALASRARPVVVVTGHAHAEVQAALAGLDVIFVHNPDFANGLSTSLRTGLAALGGEVGAAVVLLGDMPDASAQVIDALIEVFAGSPGAQAAVPVFEGRRGNPALLGRALFARAAALSGDEGARGLLAGAQVATVEAPMGVTRDVDAPTDLGFTIRDAAPCDRAGIVAAIGELQDYERQLSDTRRPGAEVAQPYYERLRERAAHDGAMLVAEADGAFAGFVVGWIEQDDEICETPESNRYGYISDISVLPAFRGRGAAAALLAALEARLAAHGVTRLRLKFLTANTTARAAYERAGFAPHETLYEKRLGPG